MSVSAVTSAAASTYTASTASSDQVTNPDSTLDKTAFLEMLLTKLKYQDPLNVSDADFTAEMAQYSTLEATQNLSDGIDAISTKLDDMNTNFVSQLVLTNTGQAVSLVGKTATVQTTDSDGNITAQDTGTVTTVKFVDGVPEIEINGVLYSLSDVTEVSAA